MIAPVIAAWLKPRSRGFCLLPFHLHHLRHLRILLRLFQRELHVAQAGVEAVAGEELGVCAGFDDFAAVDDVEAVGAAHGG